MKKLYCLIIAVIIHFPVFATSSITLSGIAKQDGSNAPLKGVRVTLSKFPNLFATTDSTGKFILSGAATIGTNLQQSLDRKFIIYGKTLIYTRGTQIEHCLFELFSSNGRKIRSTTIDNIEPGQRLLSVPLSGSGTSIIRLTLDGTFYILPFIAVGNSFYLKNERVNKAANTMRPDFTAASIQTLDTLIARKQGFLDSKIPIASYTIQDLSIAMNLIGNPNGNYTIPQDAQLADVSHPDQVVGTGTPESCTPEAFIQAVAKGGVIVFNSGSRPVTLILSKPAKIFNNAKQDVVIDGGGLITLSGGGKTRILYMNTCDSIQHWTSDHCQNQESPRLTVQNLTFANGNSKNEKEYDGGGAIWVRGGRFKVINCQFYNNVCADSGPDLGGACVRVFSQYENKPVYVVNSRFGGAEGQGNIGSNGGGLSSIGVSWTVINCLFSYNQAIGRGGNPAQDGTPGGGSGGAIYNDGNTMTLSILGTLIEHNTVKAYGSAIFFVSNDHSGNIIIDNSTIKSNIGGSWYAKPGISMHDDTKITITNSTLE
jgi:hypothetical protein